MKQGYEFDLIRNIQVKLLECGLYEGELNGKWGRKLYEGYEQLLSNYLISNDRQLVSQVTATQSPFEVILSIQSDLNVLGLFDRDFDGRWCKQCERGFSYLVEEFLRDNPCPQYGYGWSTHVPKLYGSMISRWIKKNGFKRKIGDYLLTVIYFETEGTFNKSPFFLSRLHWFAKKNELTVKQLLALTRTEQLKLLLTFLEMKMPAVVTLGDLYRAVVPPNHTKPERYEQILNNLYYEGLLLNNRTVL